MSNAIIFIVTLFLIFTIVYSSIMNSLSSKDSHADSAVNSSSEEPPVLSDSLSPTLEDVNNHGYSHNILIDHLSEMSNEVSNHVTEMNQLVDDYHLGITTKEMIDMIVILFPLFLSFGFFCLFIIKSYQFLINMIYKKQIQKHLIEAKRLSSIQELYPHTSNINIIALKQYMTFLNNSDMEEMRKKKQKLTYLIFQVKQDYGIKV